MNMTITDTINRKGNIDIFRGVMHFNNKDKMLHLMAYKT